MKKILMVSALLLIAGPALAQGPAEDVDALVARGFRLLRDKKLPEAEADFQRAIAATPCNVDASYGLSLVYNRTGQWKEAKGVWEKARENCKENAKALAY